MKDTSVSRAKLVEDVFSRSIEARLKFNVALCRCALKGWPDRADKIRHNTRFHELQMLQLVARLSHLVRHGNSAGSSWCETTSTAEVQRRLQEGWTEEEERVLRSSDAAYVQLGDEIANLVATGDAEALEEPFRMAKRDPELTASAWELNNTVLALDHELAL
jgi:hypothetical protein